MLASRQGRRFHIVLDYLCPDGPAAPTNLSNDELIARLIGLLRNFIRQQLYKERRRTDPQLENLKRRISEILQGGDIRQISVGGQMIAALKSSPAPRNTASMDWPEPDLEQIAYATYTDRRSNWCRAILAHAAETRPNCPWIPVPQLIRVMIRVNRRLIELHIGESATGAQPAVPEHLRQKAREAALGEIKTVILPGFVRKGRLTNAESAVHLRAVAAYLDDWLVHGDGADLKPIYLREADPGVDTNAYKRYKYTFERATDIAVEIAREILKKHL